MNSLSDILLNIFFIALIAFAVAGALYNLVQFFSFLNEEITSYKNRKYNLYANTECEGIFLYYADIAKEETAEPYKNIVVEVKVVSHYRNVFHTPTENHKVFLSRTSYELQRIRWNNGGSESFVDNKIYLYDNTIFLNHKTEVTSSSGKKFWVTLTSKGVDIPFQQIREFKERENILNEKYKQLKKDYRKANERIKVYEIIIPGIKDFRDYTVEEIKKICKDD